MNLYIYKYNNYYNRIVKKEDNLAAYGEPIHRLIGCKDFSPNDGVNTIHTFGSAANNYDGSGDYLIVADEYNNIVSRWFIIEINFTRSGQWNITLRRDLVVDYYDAIVNAPCFIEKATLSEEDPLIYNSENLEVNQIFTSQTLLKDETECPWFVGYYTKNAPNLSGTVSTNDLPSQVYEILEVPIESWEYVVNANETTPFKGQLLKAKYGTVYYTFGSTPAGGTPLEYHRLAYDTISDSLSNIDLNSGSGALGPGTVNNNSYVNAYKNYGVDAINAILKSYYDYHTTEEFNDFIRFNGKLLKDSTGKYFEVSITPFGTNKTTLKGFAGSLFSAMSSIATSAGLEGTPTTNTFTVEVETQEYILTYIERFDLSVNYNIPQTNKLVTENEPYNIFAIPYGEITVITEDNNSFTTTKQIAEQTVSSILGSFGGEGEGTYVYDIQLIGYCPVNYLITDNKEITLTDSRQYSLIQSGDEDDPIKGIIFNVASSSFTTNIPVNISATNKKVSSICDLYRLTAPDQSSYFDINIAKNDGSINYINIDVNLKPYNCYIHANPDFKGLYGQDFNTGRGLIYGSNLSLSRALNNFTEYQIQNSQFQNIFDRQIQNMETQNKYQRIGEQWAAAAGIGQGVAGGALAGSLLGGGFATAAGGMIGGVLSGLGGLKDLEINEKLRAEALDYTKDMFGFNIANIKAQPLTLSKITALTQNNTIFIALDYYTCTEREKEAVAYKIAWNGMTVMAIGTISEYINNIWSYATGDETIESKGYIKGQIIRVEFLEDEFHLLKEISNEIYKGVYF